MRPIVAIVALGAVMLLWAATPAPAPAAPVSFDRYSLRIEGRRVVLNSGEVHPARMPEPKEWPAVLARLRAAGLNAISIYVPWSYHEPARGRFRWRGRYDVERFLALARDAGLYVVVRPGPYINAEADGGGFPSWLLGRPGVLRSTDARYTKAWKAWFAAVLPRVARWQLGAARRGTVIAVQIENEYTATGAGPEAYMRDLYATARADGITVPLLHNDQALRRRFEDVVDLYGFDTYPYGFACCPAWREATFAGLDGVEAELPTAGRRSPIYVPELQGGAVDLVGSAGEGTSRRLYGALAGYGTVQDLTLLGQGATMLNRYMAFGGTSWGYTPFPLMGSSYDYAAPVREWLGLGPRYDELRRISGQIETAGASLAATRADPGAVTSDVPGAVYRVRRSLVDGALHVFLRNAGDTADQAPRLRIGAATTPPVALPRRSARYLLAGARVAGWSIAWSTAEAMLATRRTLVLFGDRGRRYAAVLNGRRIEFTPGRAPSAIRIAGDRTLLVVDRAGAARTWRRRGRVVVGPELVTSHEVLTDRRTSAYVLEGRALRRVRLPGPPRPGDLALPALNRWRFAAESPERRASFDDSGWRAVDQPTTTNRIQPLTGPVLDADAYGAPTGYVWYRGRFSGSAAGVCLEGRHRYFAWLNGRRLGAVTSATDVSTDSVGVGARSQPERLRFPAGAVKASGTNVLAVLTDDWGHSEDTFVSFGGKTPRGLISAGLDRGAGAGCGFRDAGSERSAAPPAPPSGGISWRIQGGAPRDYPNASGLLGERDGWFQRGFDDRGWKPVVLPDGGRLGRGEVGWYRTSFRVHLPRGLRATLGIRLPGAAPGELFLNGVHVARVGRDRSTRFVLEPGLLRTDGRPNVLALARWAFGNGGGLRRPRLFTYATERKVRLPAPRR